MSVKKYVSILLFHKEIWSNFSFTFRFLIIFFFFHFHFQQINDFSLCFYLFLLTLIWRISSKSILFTF